MLCFLFYSMKNCGGNGDGGGCGGDHRDNGDTLG